MLLTRPPLYSGPEGPFRVRLACVRRAASVDSEPGSNSRLKSPGLPARAPRGPAGAGNASARNQTKSFCTSNRSVKDPRRPGSPRPDKPPKEPPRPVPAAGQPRSRLAARAKQRPKGTNAPAGRRLTTTLALPQPARKPNLRFPDDSSRTDHIYIADLGESPRRTGGERGGPPIARAGQRSRGRPSQAASGRAAALPRHAAHRDPARRTRAARARRRRRSCRPRA